MAASRLNLLPLTLSLALRNSLRARGRLVLTLTTLTLASSFFIAVLSIYTSTRTSVEEIFRYWQYDLMINFDRPYRIEQLTHAAFQVPGVADIDPGVLVQTNRVYSDGRQGNAIFLYAMPANTFSLRPRLLEGRWLLPQDENAIVVSNRFLEEEPDVQVGDLVRLKLSGKESDWRVVGIIHMMYADGPTVYVNIPYYAQEVSSTGCASQLYVLTHLHGPAEQYQVMHELDRVFKQNGIHITFSIPMATLRASISEIFNAVVIVLMVMAILLSIVGGVGLMGIMELNVLERNREIGVLRAIGATDRRLLIIVLTEGMSIGTASWLMGSILAFPLSKWLSDAVGRAVIQTPFSYSYSYWGAGLWLVLILLLSGLSCASPAIRASRVTIREALAYE